MTHRVTEGATITDYLHWLGLVGSVGGILWLIKGGIILAGGFQPPALFGLGALCFIIGLVGLSKHIETGGLRVLGVVMVVISLVSGVALVVIDTFFPQLIPTGNFYSFPGTLLFAVVTVSPFVALIAFGGSMMQAEYPSWRAVPLGMGLSLPALFFIGGILEAIYPPLLEIPFMLFGAAWVVLGYQVWRYEMDTKQP